MTNEEAINILSGDNLNRCAQKEREALEMAIQALSQEPICDRDCEHCTWTECPIEPCDDAIGRAEAMTEIMMFAGNVKPDEEDIYIKVSDAVQLLRELPSVSTTKNIVNHGTMNITL